MKNLLKVFLGWVIVFVVLTNIGCTNSSCDDLKPSFILKKSFEKQILIIIADDRSGSDVGNRNFNLDDYKHLCDNVVANGGGTLAVLNIGNPPPSAKQAFRVTYEIPYDSIPLLECYKLSQKGLVYAWNDSIRMIINHSVNVSNINKQEAFLDTISEEVVKYKPHKDQDLTLLDDAIESISRILDEKNFDGYKKIIVCLSSDGINDPGGKHNHIPNKKIISNRDFELHVIGWKDLTYFDYLKKKPSIDESKIGFLDYVLNSRYQ